MRQETINIYTFNELSEQAKEKAREWFRSGGTSDDFDFCIEDAQRMGELLGIEFGTHAVKLYGGSTRYDANIYWSGFCSQGDGASFEGYYTYKRGALAQIKKEAPQDTELHRIAKALQQAQARNFYQVVTRVTQSGHYCHEHTMSFDHERADEKELHDDCRQIEDALRDFASWIYRQLDNENDYRNSDEYVDDCIIANDYEFYAGGKRA